jgi:beta-galactosidase/beta-glucuronidase
MNSRCKKAIAIICSCIVFQFGHSQDWQLKPSPLQTRWAKDVSPGHALPEYPRPQMVRANWQNFNGLWNYSITDSAASQPGSFEGQILVPYPLESALSGVKKSLLPDQKLWYQRDFALGKKQSDKRYLLHFGAVDYLARVLVNGKEVGTHTGGYQAFSFDITDALQQGNNKITVAVWDPTDKGNNPKGKQVLKPQGIMYTPTSGIWQTVWMETVPMNYISSLTITPNIDGGYVSIVVHANKSEPVELSTGNNKVSGTTNTEIKLNIPKARLWSPTDPYLYDLAIKTSGDEVKSYFGMRKIEIKKDSTGQERIFLNNRYTFNLGVLDQGFWPDGLYTAPTDSALAWDISAIKSMGFNTIRKHIKIEPARWYYHCDRLGMLVWQDMPYPANASAEAKAEFETENEANIKQLYNYPSIVCWVIFNEGWNKYDQERLTGWAKRMDPTRIINGHSGENYDRSSPSNPNEKWISSDLTDVHSYPGPGIAPYLSGKARVLGEWGGVRVATPGHQWDGSKSWGYIETTASAFARKYEFMARHLKLFEEEGLSASIYTQPFDVEIEENGLITYDRELFKIPAAQMMAINAMLFEKNK